MSMESFYGGRQGASFVIVTQFDGIDIPQSDNNKIYKVKEYAGTLDGIYYYEVDSNNNKYLIEKNSNNYNNYPNWIKTKCNGAEVDAIPASGSGESTRLQLPEQLAKGMVQCFTQGGASTDEVNYGEYVIIDTSSKNNPDNGKVFKRGMDYLGELGGAIYVGQIVGPQGPAPQAKFENFGDWAGEELKRTVDTEDLIPGYIPPQPGDDQGTYNNEVTYKLATLKDEFGDLIGYQIGFQTPYLVNEFTAEGTDPYDITNLITRDPSEVNEETRLWKHPYYEKWNIMDPQGIHGEDISSLEVVYTKTKPKDFIPGYEGTKYYGSDPEEYGPIEEVGVLTYEVAVLKEAEGAVYDEDNPIYDSNKVYCQIELDEGTYWVHKADCHQGIYRYKLSNYDDNATPKVTCHYINLELFDNVKIQTKTDPDTNPTVPNDGTGDQKLHIYINRNDVDPIQDVPVGAPINYIIETTIFKPLVGYEETDTVKRGHLLVYFSDPALRAELKEKFLERMIRYPSSIYSGVVWDDWFDLGQTKGDSSGIPILTVVDNLSKLYEGGDTSGVAIPPEKLMKEDSSEYINTEAAGWAVSVKNVTPGADEDSRIYFFDYDKREWIDSGTISGKNVDATRVIAKGYTTDGLQLNKGGFWFVEQDMIYAKEDPNE